MNHIFREKVVKTTFKSPKESFDFEEKIRAAFSMSYKYDSARLLIGRSLVEHSPPDPAANSKLMKEKGLSGDLLFGDNIDLWICLLMLDGNLSLDSTVDDFRDTVEAHWLRGYHLIKDEFDACGNDEIRLARRLADLIPETYDRGVSSEMPIGDAGEVRLQVGSTSELHPSGKPVDFVINGPGTAPHIALMGGVGKGKTTTGVQMAKQLSEKAKIPILFIDPKGEFVSGDEVVGPLSEFSEVRGVEVGSHPIPLDFLPPSDSPHQTIANTAMRLRDTISMCCRSPGDNQLDLLRTSIENLINDDADHSFENINTYYQQALATAGSSNDSIVSRLNELTNLSCFEPSLSPAEFFSQSWVLSLSKLPEELKRLSTLVILNTVSAFMLQQDDSHVHSGFRSLRHLLIVDEARKVLREKKYDSLADLIRQGRSKGSVVMLLSQDPSDFHGAADDFLTQIGTVVAFACNQNQKGLGALKSVFGRSLQANEFSDTYLPNGVAFVKLPENEPERIRCWSPKG